MTQETTDVIYKAVKVAIREYSKEQKSERKRKALHNTKMLLKNYDKIRNSIEEAISEADQLEHEAIGYDDKEDVYISSIRKSKLKSLIVIAHIDRAMDVVREEYKVKGVQEKYDAFIDCFMNNMTYDEAAEVYFSSKTSISRWINDVTHELSIQLFGVEGIDLV